MELSLELAFTCRLVLQSKGNMIFSLTNALLMAVAIAICQPVFASWTQEFSGRSPQEIEKKARQNGFSYPANAPQCNALMCYQKWTKV